MKRISLILLPLLVVAVLSACKKDYSCKCIKHFSYGTVDTTLTSLEGLSKQKATDFCDSETGTFAYSDIITGGTFTVTKSCELE